MAGNSEIYDSNSEINSLGTKPTSEIQVLFLKYGFMLDLHVWHFLLSCLTKVLEMSK